MRLLSDRKLFFCLLGMPRSGTTIITRFFDALDNACCASEPLLPQCRRCYIPPLPVFSMQNRLNTGVSYHRAFTEEFKEQFLASDLQAAGYKEVKTRLKAMGTCDLLFEIEDLFDLQIFIARHPRDIWFSMHKAHFRDTDVFVEGYNRLLRRAMDKGMPCLDYARFCRNPRLEVNSVLRKWLRVEGELDLTKPYWSDSLGDRGAVTATSISPFAVEHALDPQLEAELELEAVPLYTQIITNEHVKK